MQVLKFGGTSVANAANIKKVKEIVQSRKDKTVVVVSALGGVTDLLLECGHLAPLFPELSPLSPDGKGKTRQERGQVPVLQRVYNPLAHDTLRTPP